LAPEKVEGVEDLTRLPFVYKKDLKTGFPAETVSRSVPRIRMSLRATAGTGQLFHLYDDVWSAGYVIASRLLYQSWMGLRVGDRILWVSSRPPNFRTRLRRLLTGLPTYPAAYLDQNPKGALRAIESKRPMALMGDASVLSSLARTMLRERIDSKMRLQAISSSAEVLLPRDRHLITSAFGCPVFDRYGLAEGTGYVAQECEFHEGLHVNGGLVIAEVVKDGELCGPGQTGRLVITNLHNYAMPFIRYDTGDLATVGDGCSCGRAFPLLSRIEGRSPGWVYTRKGTVSWTRFLMGLQLANPSIEEFQFLQPRIGQLTLRVAPKLALTEEQIRQLEQRLNNVDSSVKVTVESVEFIHRAGSGKRLPFIPLSD